MTAGGLIKLHLRVGSNEVTKHGCPFLCSEGVVLSAVEVNALLWGEYTGILPSDDHRVFG
jgi:hypothetical protein